MFIWWFSSGEPFENPVHHTPEPVLDISKWKTGFGFLIFFRVIYERKLSNCEFLFTEVITKLFKVSKISGSANHEYTGSLRAMVEDQLKELSRTKLLFFKQQMMINCLLNFLCWALLIGSKRPDHYLRFL